MLELKDKAQCCGCGACAQACPKQCITMQLDSEGFLYPHVSQADCIHCGLCEKVCPVLNVKPEEAGKPTAYAAYSKNDEQRLNSSSGGIFSLLAEQTLQDGGIVFGAAMSADCRSVQHIGIESKDELPRLQGSKYLQSTIGSTYQQAKQALDAGRYVLFSGTPCQIEGLKSFLRKDYANLLCVDLICHGAPSPKLWDKYVRFREQRAGAHVQRTFFRHKEYGWKTYAVWFEFSNHTAYVERFARDPFMQMFLQNLCLRPSCYQCCFKKCHRVSDITLADFWGCQSVCRGLDDDKGLSAVMVHSAKGMVAFEKLQDKVVSKQVDVRQVIAGNSSMVQSCKKPEKRDEFMRKMDELTIGHLARKYVKRPSIMPRIKARIAAMIPARVRKVLKGMLALMRQRKNR